MAFFVENGYPIFTGSDGLPLENGYIFIGVENLNPLSNPQEAFWDEDLTVPAANIRTSGGYAVYKGSPGRIHTAAAYSLLVQDQNRNTVYYQPKMMDLSSNFPDPEPGVGGLPLGAILPSNGATFSKFLALGTTGYNDVDYPDLAASGIDVVKDNGDGTFDLLDSGGTTGWVANSSWEGITITVTHNLQVDFTDFDIEFFVSSLGTEATAIKIMDTSVDTTPAAAFIGGVAAYGLDNTQFLVRTGDSGVDLVNTDGTRLTLTTQSWYYKITYKRKDLPYPAQINSEEQSSTLDGGTPAAQNIGILFRRGDASTWATENPILEEGEPGYAVDENEIRIGDGTTDWNSLVALSGAGGSQWNIDSSVSTGVATAVVGSVIAWDGSDYQLDDRDETAWITLGVVKDVNGDVLTVTNGQPVTGLVGLTPGARYYNSSTPGGRTTDTAATKRTVGIGIALNATTLLVAVDVNTSNPWAPDMPIGMIEAFGGTAAPTGWLECDGEVLSRTVYADLFDVIGLTWSNPWTNGAVIPAGAYRTDVAGANLYTTVAGGTTSGTDIGDDVGVTWVAADTVFQVPDLREAALVGAGENSVEDIAAHDTYTVGEFKDDQMQGHWHKIFTNNNSLDPGSNAQLHPVGGPASGLNSLDITGDDVVKDPITDGTNGTPRTGTTTRGKRSGVLYCIKATLTSAPAGVVVDAPVGAMMNWPSTTLPDGYLLRDGQEYSQSVYPELYAVLGDTYNVGGETAGHFRVPDDRDRYPRFGFHGSVTTVTVADDTVELTDPSGTVLTDSHFRDGTPIRLRGSDTPAGITAGTTYYLHYVTNDWTLHTTEADAVAGTSAVTITDVGSGSILFDQLGIELEDAFQGWQAAVTSVSTTRYGAVIFNDNRPAVAASAGISTVAYDPTAQGIATGVYPADDGTNGTPRTTNETRGRTSFATPIIKAVSMTTDGSASEAVNGKFIGEMFIRAGNAATTSALFPAACLTNIETYQDFTVAQWPLLVPYLRMQKWIYMEGQTGETTTFAGTASGSDITFTATTANDAMLAALAEQLAAYSDDYDALPALNWDSTDHAISGINTVTRVVTVTGTPTAGAGNATFYPHRIAGSANARHVSLRGRTIIGAGGAEGETIAGAVRRDHGQLVEGDFTKMLNDVRPMDTTAGSSASGAFQKGSNTGGAKVAGGAATGANLLFDSSSSTDSRVDATTTHSPDVSAHIYIAGGRYVA